mmetsp:Transcript_8984/g.23518  ORF Transcript_8984/g.23518 Transcript_8984/m.23518 type:complete len:123 (-) Transcript_8984:276-644(-)
MMERSGGSGIGAVCANCGRDPRVEREECSRDGAVYCGQNCYWSRTLDAANVRLRGGNGATKHAAKATAQRGGAALRTTAQAQQHEFADTMQDYGHAMFQLDVSLHAGHTASAPQRTQLKLGA